MSRFQKIAEKLASYGLDAMMITSEPNRLYAAQFHIIKNVLHIGHRTVNAVVADNHLIVLHNLIPADIVN